jgi:glycosyltransferase involved in cell wall biosynthesis
MKKWLPGKIKPMKVIDNRPLISVIIPMYNAEETISHALGSIKQQTEGRFEIIVVNDGSTDNSIDEVYAFKKSNPALYITIIDKPHEGVSATRNAGLGIAKGNYIAFLDADDAWYPEKTVKQLAMLNHTADIDVVGCLHSPLAKQKVNKRFTTSRRIVSKDMLFRNFFQTSTVMMKRKVFETTGYFERSVSHGEERRYFLSASKVFSCVLINENLINYGNGKRAFGQNGLSADLLQMEMGELKNLVYAYRALDMPFFTCCNAIVFSLMKFVRRLCIVYMLDPLKPLVSGKK